MNYEYLKKKMAVVLNNMTAEELVKKFEELGYEFEDNNKKENLEKFYDENID